MNSALNVFWQLTKKDMLQFRHEFVDKFINTAFLFFTNVTVFAYFMPKFATDFNFGPFIMIGAIASFGLFDTTASVSVLVADIEGDRALVHTVSFPWPSWMVFLQLAVRWALQSMLLVIPLFLLGKVLLWETLDISKVNFVKLILIFVSANLFFGSFSIWLSSTIKKLGNISNIFMRVINPLFMLGGYFFTWKNAMQTSEVFGYAILVNPMLYVMEGIRSAFLGPKDFLPYWNCLGVLWIFILSCGYFGVRKLRKRLDCV